MDQLCMKNVFWINPPEERKFVSLGVISTNWTVTITNPPSVCFRPRRFSNTGGPSVMAMPWRFQATAVLHTTYDRSWCTRRGTCGRHINKKISLKKNKSAGDILIKKNVLKQNGLKNKWELNWTELKIIEPWLQSKCLIIVLHIIDINIEMSK